MHKNLKAFLDVIAWSELGTALIESSDRGYNILVGSLPSRIKLFHDYSDHPRILVKLNSRLSSTAAGRYQILKRTFDAYKNTLSLPDFSPASQDKIAVQLITERRAIPDIEAGRIVEAIDKVRKIWASLPGAGYSQHENTLTSLLLKYRAAGGGNANAK